jgi:hypothetical protein
VSAELSELQRALWTAGEIVVGIGVDAADAERVPQQLDQFAITLTGCGKCQMTEEWQTFLCGPRQVQFVRTSLAAVIRAIARRAHGRLVTVIAAVIFAVAVSVNWYATAVTARQFGQPAGATTATATANIAAATLATPAHYTVDAAAVRRVCDQQQQQQRDDTDNQRPELLPITLVESSSGISYLLFDEKAV